MDREEDHEEGGPRGEGATDIRRNIVAACHAAEPQDLIPHILLLAPHLALDLLVNPLAPKTSG